MKRLIVVLVGSAALALPLMSAAQDVETYLNVEKAKAEVSACNRLLDKSKALGSGFLTSMTYKELNAEADRLTHCGWVFRIVGQAQKGDLAGDESDRYDATAGQQMQNYLRGKGLWSDFLKTDCRSLSTTCGNGKAVASK